MSTNRDRYYKTTNFDRSLLKSHVTEALIKKQNQLNNFAPKITQNNFESFTPNKHSKSHRKNSIDFHESKVEQTMSRRLGENFTDKPWHQKNQYMRP